MQNLEDRTLEFAIRVRKFILDIPKNMTIYEDGKQVVRSSGSIGANYIEANENLGVKDLSFRMKIARKEAKETVYWFKIIKGSNNLNEELLAEIEYLIDEANQLRKILSAIIIKLEK